MNTNENQQSAEEMLIDDLADLLQYNADNVNCGEDPYPVGDRTWYADYLADMLTAVHEDGIRNSDDAWAAWVYYTLQEGLLDPSLTDERYAELVAAAQAQVAAG